MCRCASCRLTFIFARKVSMLASAVWNTSEGRSYHTLRQRSTCALPSLMPGEMVAWPETGAPGRGRDTSPARRLSSWWSRGWTSITTCAGNELVKIFFSSLFSSLKYFRLIFFRNEVQIWNKFIKGHGSAQLSLLILSSADQLKFNRCRGHLVPAEAAAVI